ncbi:MAG: hypothetical protein ABIH52_01165 [Candidatus Aenigmatarchaeota archaeon]
MKHIKQAKERSETRWKYTVRVLKVAFFWLIGIFWIAYGIIYALMFILSLIVKVLGYLKTIAKLWRFFNKMCPYVMPTVSVKRAETQSQEG